MFFKPWLGRLCAVLVIASFVGSCGTPQPAAPTPVVTSPPKASQTAGPATATPVPAAVPRDGAPVAVAAPVQADGQQWTVCDVPSEGFAISIPSGWTQISQNAPEFEAALKATESQNPQLAGFMRTARAHIATNMKFQAIDLASAALGFANNVNVIVDQLPVPMTLDQYVQANLQQLKQLPNVKAVTNKRVQIDAGAAEQLNCRITMRWPTGQMITTSTTQYLIVKGRTAYVVSLTTSEDKASANAELLDKIGKSFRVTK